MGKHNPLTNFADAQAFADFLKLEALRSARYERPLTLLVFSVCNLDDLLARHGAAHEEEIANHLCGLCNDMFREVDGVGCMGRARFAILLPETDMHGAVQAAKRFKSFARGRPFRVNHTPEELLVCVGLSQVHSPDDDLTLLVERPDLAL